VTVARGGVVRPAEAGGLGLPPLLWHTAFPTLGEWLDACWWTYRAIVADAGLTLWGRPVKGQGGQAADGRDAAFWHCITNDDGAGVRSLQPLRGAVLPTAWELLRRLGAGEPGVVWWRQERRRRGQGGENWRLFVAPEDFCAKVVLQPTANSFLFVTCYPVGGNKREATRRRWAASWESGASCLGLYRPRHYREHAWWAPAAGRRDAQLYALAAL
jgi:hypothetical protein